MADTNRRLGVVSQKTAAISLVTLLQTEVVEERIQDLLSLGRSKKLAFKATAMVGSPVFPEDPSLVVPSIKPIERDEVVLREERKLYEEQLEAGAVVSKLLLPFLRDYDKQSLLSRLWRSLWYPVGHYRQLAVEELAKEELNKLIYQPSSVSRNVICWIAEQVEAAPHIWPPVLQQVSQVFRDFLQHSDALPAYIEQSRTQRGLHGRAEAEEQVDRVIQRALSAWSLRKNYSWWGRRRVELAHSTLDGESVRITLNRVGALVKTPFRQTLHDYAKAREKRWQSWDYFSTWFVGRFIHGRERQLELLAYHDSMYLHHTLKTTHQGDIKAAEPQLTVLTDCLHTTLSLLGRKTSMNTVGTMLTRSGQRRRQLPASPTVAGLQTTVDTTMSALTQKLKAVLKGQAEVSDFITTANELKQSAEATYAALLRQNHSDMPIAEEVSRLFKPLRTLHQLYLGLANQIEPGLALYTQAQADLMDCHTDAVRQLGEDNTERFTAMKSDYLAKLKQAQADFVAFYARAAEEGLSIPLRRLCEARWVSWQEVIELIPAPGVEATALPYSALSQQVKVVEHVANRQLTFSRASLVEERHPNEAITQGKLRIDKFKIKLTMSSAFLQAHYKVLHDKLTTDAPSSSSSSTESVSLEAVLAAKQAALNAFLELLASHTQALMAEYSEVLSLYAEEAPELVSLLEETKHIYKTSYLAVYDTFSSGMQLLQVYYSAEIAGLNRQPNAWQQQLRQQRPELSEEEILREHVRVIGQRAGLIGKSYQSQLADLTKPLSREAQEGDNTFALESFNRLYSQQQQLYQLSLEQARDANLKALAVASLTRPVVDAQTKNNRELHHTTQSSTHVLPTLSLTEAIKQVEILISQLRSYGVKLEEMLWQSSDEKNQFSEFMRLHYQSPSWESLEQDYQQLIERLNQVAGAEQLTQQLRQYYASYAKQKSFYRDTYYWLEIVKRWQEHALQSIHENATGPVTCSEKEAHKVKQRQQRRAMHAVLRRCLAHHGKTRAEPLAKELEYNVWQAELIARCVEEVEHAEEGHIRHIAWQEPDALTWPAGLTQSYGPLMAGVERGQALSEIDAEALLYGCADAQADWLRYQWLTARFKEVVYRRLCAVYAPYRELGACLTSLQEDSVVQENLRLVKEHQRQMQLKYHPDKAGELGEVWHLTMTGCMDELLRRLRAGLQAGEEWIQTHTDEISKDEGLRNMIALRPTDDYVSRVRASYDTFWSKNAAVSSVPALDALTQAIAVQGNAAKAYLEPLKGQWPYARLLLLSELHVLERRCVELSESEPGSPALISVLEAASAKRREFNRTYRYGVVSLESQEDAEFSAAELDALLPAGYERGYVLHYHQQQGQRRVLGVYYLDREEGSCLKLAGADEIQGDAMLHQHAEQLFNEMIANTELFPKAIVPTDTISKVKLVLSQALEGEAIDRFEAVSHYSPAGMPKQPLIHAMAATLAGDEEFIEDIFLVRLLISHSLKYALELRVGDEASEFKSELEGVIAEVKEAVGDADFLEEMAELERRVERAKQEADAEKAAADAARREADAAKKAADAEKERADTAKKAADAEKERADKLEEKLAQLTKELEQLKRERAVSSSPAASKPIDNRSQIRPDEVPGTLFSGAGPISDATQQKTLSDSQPMGVNP